MANVYANADVAAGKIGAAANVGGVPEYVGIVSFAVAAADAAGTVEQAVLGVDVQMGEAGVVHRGLLERRD